MKKYFLLFIPALLILIAATSKNSTSKKTCKPKTARLTTLSKNGITLTELYSVENFSNAVLKESFASTAADLDSNKIVIDYTTENYELGKQTDMSGIKTCANSAKGQHIHNIIDNEPYTAIYDPKATVKAKNEGQHFFLSFLSRSYHESIKSKHAYILSTAITGKSRYAARYARPNLESPMLFYSRPKGEYTGSETDAVLLDFYLVNCDLSKTGYSVLAEINGNKFKLTKWCGYFMEGLPMGENTVKLSLLDIDGKVVNSPFSVSERKFTLKK
ncbi:MAG: hypothetical protein JWN78_2414 [Bacteroidota bacterium]|nr:hypothetical protein [Bacteroidota bacterium]